MRRKSTKEKKPLNLKKRELNVRKRDKKDEKNVKQGNSNQQKQSCMTNTMLVQSKIREAVDLVTHMVVLLQLRVLL